MDSDLLLWDLADDGVAVVDTAAGCVIDEPLPLIAPQPDPGPELPLVVTPPAATAVSQKLAPGWGGGGCWLGGPRTASTEKFENTPAAPTGAPDGFALFGRNLFGDDIQQVPGGRLAERFTLPPFSVLNAREGAWQDRKRAWLSLGIQSELGRGGGTGTWIESETGGPDDRQRDYAERERVASFKNQDKLDAFRQKGPQRQPRRQPPAGLWTTANGSAATAPGDRSDG